MDQAAQDWRSVAESYQRSIVASENIRDELRAELDAARAEIETFKAHARPVLRAIERGEPVHPEDLALFREDVDPRSSTSPGRADR